MALSWTFRAHSEIGLVRKNNQDSGFVGRRLLLVADGMGGAAAGDLASAVAVDSIRVIDDADVAAEGAVEGAQPEGSDPDAAGSAQRNLSALSNAIFHANSRIADLVSADFTLEGMGTTVTAALLEHDRLSLAHIGDSRAYLWRAGTLERLTHDHSWVQSLIDEGKISEAEAAVHPHRSLLLKVLNGHPANEADLTTVELRDGDRLLFCSDGLCGFVEDDRLETALGLPDLDQAMTMMIEAAHQAGGLDNITIILAELSQRDAGPGAVTTGSAGVEPQTLGAAAERDIPDLDTMVRDRLLPEGDDDPDDSDPGADADAGADSGPGTGDGSDDEDRYAPQPPARRRLARPLVGVLVLALVLAAGVGAGFAWSRTQFFVGNSDGQVAIFRGISGTPSALGLAQVYEVQQLPVTALPPLYQEMVNSAIDVADLGAARATVEQLRQAANACQGKQTPITPSTASTSTASTSTASTTPGTTASGTPSGTARASASARATASVSRSAVAPLTPTATTSGVLPPGGQSC